LTVTNFEKITESPDALAAFLRSLNVIDGPWDISFTECAEKNQNIAEKCTGFQWWDDV